LQDCTYTEGVAPRQLIHVSCDIRNTFGSAQGDIRYGVQLVRRAGETYELLHTMVYDDVLALAAGQSMKKEFEYQPPAYLSGEYELWGVLRTSDGLPLATNLLGAVVLQGTASSYIEIQSNTCFLHVRGESNEIKYTPQFGVDIDSNEVLEGTCTARVGGAGSITATPSFKTHYRTVFGEVVPDTQDAQTPVTFDGDSLKEFTFTVPKAATPQAYDAVLSLVNSEGEVVSNSVPLHYVLRGPSATIQNVLLDKNNYVKGDVAKVSLSWTGSADSFLGARKDPTSIELQGIVMSIKDGDVVCAKEEQFPADKNNISQETMPEYSLEIVADCPNPQVVVRVVDTAGATLVEKVVNLNTEVTGETTSNDTENIENIYKHAAAALFGLIVLLGMLITQRRKNNQTTI